MIGHTHEPAEREQLTPGELFHAVAEAASEAIITIDEASKILFVNRSVEKIFGYTVEELRGAELTMLIPDYLRHLHRIGVNPYVETAEQHILWKAIELPGLHKGGREIPLETSFGKFIKDGQCFITGIVRDISERKRTEQAMRENEEWMRTIFDASRDGILVEDDEVIVYVNKSYARLLGYDKTEELIGTSVLGLLPPAEAERLAEYGRRRGRGESVPSVYEFKAKRKDGTLIDVEAAVSTSLIGGKIYITTALRDIAERKRAQEAFREADQRAIVEYERLLDRIAALALALGTARDLTTIFRSLRDFAVASTPCSGLFISLYHRERNMRTPAYAWSAGEEVVLSNLPPMPMNDSPHSRAVATGEIIITDDFQSATAGLPVVNVGLKSDPRLPQSSLVVPMSVMGRILGAIEAQSTELASFKHEHATAMRMAANLAAIAVENVQMLEREDEKEEQLRQSQRMEAVGQLAGGIAHDFNNLLVVINSYSELLLRSLAQDAPQRRKVEEIKKAGDRAASLTHQLLAFSRRQVLQPKVLDLNTVVSDIDQMLQRLIGENIQLVTVLDPLAGQVKVDPGQISQVLMNLVVNSRDAMPQGGKIVIETANVALDENYGNQRYVVQPGSYVMLAVSDNGTGMDLETQEHVFEPFFTTKEVGRGTGLGLSTVYGIVKQSGGYIWVNSEVGRGTTFEIYLPRIEEEAESAGAGSDSSDLQQGTEAILLVEDEDAVRLIVREILEMCGYEVLEARNGAEAIAICERQEREIELLITDVVMPQMSGRELAERLSVLRPQLRVLYMSGYTDDAIVHHGVLDEGISFLGKPFMPEALARKVREVLDAPGRLHFEKSLTPSP